MTNNWSYFLEDYNGDVLKELHNVPFNEAPARAEIDDDDNIIGYWHPFEKD